MTTPATFLIRFFDSRGLGAIISEQSISVTATDTGLKGSFGQDILLYSTSLADVSLGSGTSWISIMENDPSIPTDWAWSFGDNGNGLIAARLNDSGPFSFIGTPSFTYQEIIDMTFTISSVPEPSSLLMAGPPVALGLGRWLRHRKRVPARAGRPLVPVPLPR